jgi:deazaflavin-dependent oxidoreductase (nitroreductase family)
MTINLNDRNAGIINEFRNNQGKIGGRFENTPILLLHTIGAKSGQERINPLACHMDGDRYVIIASKAGAPTNPDWYYNLLAHPEVTIEIGTQTLKVKASVVEGEERERIYNERVSRNPGFGEYREKTTRVIPVILLTPIA